MSAGCFVDTTVLIDLIDPLSTSVGASDKFIAANQPAELPYYALKELVAGHLRNICDAHNLLLAAQNAGEATFAVMRLSPLQGRKREAKLAILARHLANVHQVNPDGSRSLEKQEMLDDLVMRAFRLWDDAKVHKKLTNVQQLSCFNHHADLLVGSDGELRGPGDSWNCSPDERCAAAAYMFEDLSTLDLMIDALRPPKQVKGAQTEKRETTQRRNALKELRERGPRKMHKGYCRQLGDAYFAGMCPIKGVVVTTNLVDHEPLCAALNKRAVKP